MQMNNREHSGIVLLVVLGVLALLSVLAITFVSMTRLERSISRNYVDRTRAIMTAESGIEYAIKRIANFRGGILLPEEAADMAYQDGDLSIPLAQADQPSFRIPGQPYSGTVSSSHTGDGDRFRLKVADLSSRINLNDGNEELNLPPPPYDTGYAESGTRRLSLMISYLCELLFAESKGAGAGDVVATVIEQAKDERPGGCFSSMDEVKELLVDQADFSEQDWFIFEQYFTIFSWQDTNVLRPTFKVGWLDTSVNPPILNVDITVPDDESDAPLYDDGGADLYLYLDMQTTKFAPDSRSPVNINTAPREIIQTLFALVSGWYLKEGPGETLSDGHYGRWKIIGSEGPFQYYYADEAKVIYYGREVIGKRNTYGVIGRTIDFSDPGDTRLPVIANIIWSRIHGRLDLNGDGDYSDPMETDHPKPFATWDEFRDFIKTVFAPDPDNGTSLLLPDDAALGIDSGLSEDEKNWWRNYYFDIYSDQYLANFNPNSQLNDYNPNLSMFRHIDKSQLVTYSTEFCFEPTGYFEIQSLGEILGNDGRVIAGPQIHAIVKVFEYFRQTTQAQFMAGYETEADLGYYFSQSSHLTTALAGLSSLSGYSLQSYPEPVTEENYLADSHFDGQLMLATWQPELAEYEVDVSDYYPPPEIGDLNPVPSLRATFRQDVKAEDYGNNPQTDYDTEAPSDTEFMEFTFPGFYKAKGEGMMFLTFPSHFFNYPCNDRLTYDLSAEDPVPGAIFPDGALSDACRSIGFPAGNFGKDGGRIGAMHFWIKPNFDVGNSTRVRQLISFFRTMSGCNILGPAQQSLYYFCNNNHNREINIDFYHDTIAKFNKPLWTATRSFAAGWGYSVHNAVGLLSSTVNHDFPEHSDSEHGTYHEYNFDSRQWNHIGLSWNVYGSSAPDASWFLVMSVNGQPVDPRRWGKQGNFSESFDIWRPVGFFDGPNVFSFGESVFGRSLINYQNYVADCTFDDIIGYLDFVPCELYPQFYQWGRYYNQSDAVYTSPEINLHRELKLDRREILQPRSVSWTVYWPKYNRDGDQVVDDILPPTVNPNDPEDPLAEKWGASLDPISIDVGLRKEGYTSTDWMFRNQASEMATYAGGSVLKSADANNFYHIDYTTKFCYQVRFNLEPGQTLYDTPVFDDISFTFHIKPRILRWQIVN
ncbi:hypothetical protein ACFL54_05360 [Planctomycetota bacterium]